MTPVTRILVSVVGLFVDGGEVLLLHQTTLPEPNCWDLPGGGLEPHEPLLDGLRREVQEETGLTDFQVDGVLTVLDSFFPEKAGCMVHTINIVYRCSVSPKPQALTSDDPEVGPNGIRWLPICRLTADQCSRRAWRSLQVSGEVPLSISA